MRESLEGREVEGGEKEEKGEEGGGEGSRQGEVRAYLHLIERPTVVLRLLANEINGDPHHLQAREGAWVCISQVAQCSGSRERWQGNSRTAVSSQNSNSNSSR
jgi:hypothetical protein